MGNSQQVTVLNSASQDAASGALAAADRVLEAKQLFSKADAVWLYAQRAGDYKLQNEAAEIRLFAKRRASELMAEMAIHSASRRQGRTRRDGAKVEWSNSATAYPVMPKAIGAPKSHPSKWRMPRWISALSTSNGRVGAKLYRALHFPSVRTLWKHP